MDGLIGLLILMGAVFYARLRMDARKNAQKRERQAAQAKVSKPRKSSQQNRHQDSYRSLTKRLQAMAATLQSGEGFEAFGDNEKRRPSYTKGAQISAGDNPDRPEIVASAIEQELQSTGKTAELTFEEEALALEAEAIALQQTYDQLGNVFDESIADLFSNIPDYGSSQPQLGEVIIQAQKSKPRVTTNIQTIKQGIIMANVLERPQKRQAPAYIRRKGV